MGSPCSEIGESAMTTEVIKRHVVTPDVYNRHYVVCINCKHKFIIGYKWESTKCFALDIKRKRNLFRRVIAALITKGKVL